MEKEFGTRGLTVVGIHTPEFDYERSRSNVERAIAQHALGDHSHLLDTSMTYWRALGNQYWPAIYLVDRCRRIRERTIGETHLGTPRDTALREKIETLLKESPPHCGG
jgi:hypothetical protein